MHAGRGKPCGRFFRISHCRCSRMFSARRRDNSICSGVIALLPAPLSLPAAAALTQLRSVCSTSPSSRATAPMPWPAFTRFTASSLNSAVYSCFGIFNCISPFRSSRLNHYAWKTKFRGKLNPVSFVDPTGLCWQAVWRGGNIMGWVPCGTPNTSPNSLPSSTSLPASTVAQTCPAPTPDPIPGLLDPASIAIQPVCPDCWIIGGIAGGKLLAGAAGVSGTQFIGGVLTGAAILAGPTGGKNPMKILQPLLTQVQNVRQIKNAASAAKSATGAGSP